VPNSLLVPRLAWPAFLTATSLQRCNQQASIGSLALLAWITCLLLLLLLLLDLTAIFKCFPCFFYTGFVLKYMKFMTN
jgi:hypothetical protein